MDQYTMTEQAYKNGYNAALKELSAKIKRKTATTSLTLGTNQETYASNSTKKYLNLLLMTLQKALLKNKPEVRKK